MQEVEFDNFEDIEIELIPLAEIEALVIPVGLAFKRAYAARPEIELHKSFDGSHPSLLGTYLAACVVYGSLYQQPCRNSSYDYFGAVSSADARFLQGIADQTVTEFQQRQRRK